MIILAYYVTADLADRFHAVQQLQKEVYPTDSMHRVVVTDEAKSIVGPFSIVTCSGAKVKNESNALYFSLLKNVLLDYAEKSKADLLVTLDADAVLCHAPKMPTASFYTAKMRHVDMHASNEVDLGNSGSVPYVQSGYLVQKSDTFHLRYDERFVGYGYEDVDYFHNILAK